MVVTVVVTVLVTVVVGVVVTVEVTVVVTVDVGVVVGVVISQLLKEPPVSYASIMEFSSCTLRSQSSFAKKTPDVSHVMLVSSLGCLWYSSAAAFKVSAAHINPRSPVNAVSRIGTNALDESSNSVDERHAMSPGTPVQIPTSSFMMVTCWLQSTSAAVAINEPNGTCTVR